MLFAAGAAIWVDHRVVTQPDAIIRPFMQLEISLDVNPPATRALDVDLSGRIDLPLIGKMKASGLTCAQLETKIHSAYWAMGTTADPRVSVRIVGLHPPGRLLMSLLLTIPAMRLLGYCWSSSKIRRRLRAGLCVRCSYDLRATPDRCPECGQVPTHLKA